MNICTVLLISLVSVGLIWTMIGAVGRHPTARDTLACRQAYRENLVNITGLYDPNAKLQAFYVRDGSLCLTYCRVTSRDPRVGTQTFPSIVSPEFEECATKRHCDNNATCVSD